MVSTRRGEYTTPEKTPHLPPHDEDDGNSSKGGEGIAVGASLNYDDDSAVSTTRKASTIRTTIITIITVTTMPRNSR